ncbi:TPA: hypothetical protein TUL08_001798 [Streptococcus equi subsp. zooepidemicus]|nr:hypothetical protein [Streptococcus equi subsp. zooepidemicus]HEL0012584.1 hypothetical protein [Streptococcus equi subsp. zooepidemicus]HEL0014648.1 hypothetical protein [Streptococcus equi subsp. zooepidemicus]HEL0030604.1 hypothetical protein [Streptococcus equi subsp. zooepidemicus]HEL0032583.1 hypothetical protein [Streptococcus equi subsp. zooepidemicus]
MILADIGLNRATKKERGINEMKKKLPILLLVLVLLLTTMVGGLNAITASASGNETSAIKQEQVVKTENKNTKENHIKDEKQSQYKNDVVTQSDDKPLGLDNDTATKSDVKTLEKEELKTNEKDITELSTVTASYTEDPNANGEPERNLTIDPDGFGSTKIVIHKDWDDNMDGFSPKIELINKGNGNALFTLEKGKMPAFKKDEGTVTIDTKQLFDSDIDLRLKMDNEVIDIDRYGGGEAKITIDGKQYRVNGGVWIYADKNKMDTINIYLHQIYKPEHQVLKVKKYWYDCHFEYEENFPTPTVTAKISNPKVAPQKDNSPQELDGTFVSIKGGRELTSSEIPVSKVKVRLYVDGKPTDQTIELKEDGNWEGEFDVKKWVTKDGFYGYYDDDEGFRHFCRLSLVEEGTQENAEPTHES